MVTLSETERFLRGDFDPDEDRLIAVSPTSYRMMQKMLLDAAKMSINPRFVVDPGALPADVELKPGERIALEPLRRGPCKCNMCVELRRLRWEKARDAAYAADRNAKTAAELPPKPMRVSVVGRCDCPGCMPAVATGRSAAGGGREFSGSPMGRALRFAGLNTPDPKRLGAAQYTLGVKV
jgi:hypothetical protein